MSKYFKNIALTLITLTLAASATFATANNYKIIFKNQIISDKFNAKSE